MCFKLRFLKDGIWIVSVWIACELLTTPIRRDGYTLQHSGLRMIYGQLLYILQSRNDGNIWVGCMMNKTTLHK